MEKSGRKDKTMHIRNQKRKRVSLLKCPSDENIQLAKHARVPQVS